MLIVAVFSKVTSDVIGIAVLTYFSRSQGSKTGKLIVDLCDLQNWVKEKNV